MKKLIAPVVVAANAVLGRHRPKNRRNHPGSRRIRRDPRLQKSRTEGGYRAVSHDGYEPSDDSEGRQKTCSGTLATRPYCGGQQGHL